MATINSCVCTCCSLQLIAKQHFELQKTVFQFIETQTNILFSIHSIKEVRYNILFLFIPSKNSDITFSSSENIWYMKFIKTLWRSAIDLVYIYKYNEVIVWSHVSVELQIIDNSAYVVRECTKWQWKLQRDISFSKPCVF